MILSFIVHNECALHIAFSCSFTTFAIASTPCVASFLSFHSCKNHFQTHNCNPLCLLLVSCLCFDFLLTLIANHSLILPFKSWSHPIMFCNFNTLLHLLCWSISGCSLKCCLMSCDRTSCRLGSALISLHFNHMDLSRCLQFEFLCSCLQHNTCCWFLISPHPNGHSGGISLSHWCIFFCCWQLFVHKLDNLFPLLMIFVDHSAMGFPVHHIDCVRSPFAVPSNFVNNLFSGCC